MYHILSMATFGRRTQSNTLQNLAFPYNIQCYLELVRLLDNKQNLILINIHHKQNCLLLKTNRKTRNNKTLYHKNVHRNTIQFISDYKAVFITM